MRAWDEGDPNANLDRVSQLIQTLNGAKGSGRRFVEDAETLLLLGDLDTITPRRRRTISCSGKPPGP